MAHPSVTAFVEQASGSDSLKQRLQSANLSELLAIAREHDLHMGEADALYAHAKHGMELWGIGHSVGSAIAISECPGGCVAGSDQNQP